MHIPYFKPIHCCTEPTKHGGRTGRQSRLGLPRGFMTSVMNDERESAIRCLAIDDAIQVQHPASPAALSKLQFQACKSDEQDDLERLGLIPQSAGRAQV